MRGRCLASNAAVSRAIKSDHGMLDTKRIDGKARAERLVATVAATAAQLKAAAGVVPGLCAVLVGEDPASQIYVRNKGKSATAAGIQSFQKTCRPPRPKPNCWG